MKRTLTLLAGLLLAAWLAPEARAVEFDYTVSTGQTLHFASTSGNAYYLKASAAGGEVAGDLSIPGSIAYNGVNYFVTEIEDYGFEDCTGLTSVVLPSTIQTIGYDAFRECYALTSINIPESVTSIGYYAFGYCESLSLLQVPASVTTVGSYAFYNVSIVVWSNYDGSNSYGAYKMCAKIEDGLLFNDLAGTTVAGMLPEYTAHVTIPEGVTTIAEYAFSGDTNITDITLPGTLTTIQCYAFYGCSKLETINIPGSVTSIGTDAFNGCSSINLLELPQGVAVNDCPGGHYHYSANHYDGYSTYTTFWGVEYLVWPGYTGHYGARIVCSVYEDGLFYQDMEKTILMGGDESVNNLVIPSTVTTVTVDAFFGHEGLTSLTIPSTVTSIGNHAFACPNLTTVDYNVTRLNTSIFSGSYNYYISDSYYNISYSSPIANLTIGEGVEYLPSNFLKDDSLLTAVTLPESIDTIGENAFYGTGLTELTIPAGVEKIGAGAFACPNLTSLNYNAVNADAQAIFHNTTNSYGWYGYSPIVSHISNLTLGDAVEAIPDFFIQNDTSLTEVTLPASVRSIGYHAFRNTGISSIVIPEGVESIGEFAFSGPMLAHVEYNATNATHCDQDPFAASSDDDYNYVPQTLTIGENVLTLPTYVFNGMSITEVVLPEGLQTIDEDAFFYCNQLTSITIPDNVTTIGDGAFSSCYQLAEIVIGNGVSQIGEYAFDCGNTSLNRRLTIGENVATIGDGAFHNNRFDTIFMLPTVPPTIESSTFLNVPTNTRIMVPCNTLADYEDAPYWSDFTRMAEAASCGNIITVLSSDATMGSVGGSGSYSTGSVATLSAMPKMNYGFAGWADGSNDNPRLVLVNGDASYTANFTAMAGGIVHDTTTVTVHDTVHITVPVHDTLTVEVPVHDTLIVGDGDTLTVYIHDTTTVEVPVYDTVIVDNSTVDTLWLTDTVYITLTDTVYVHDTVYVPQDGIDDILPASAKIYQRDGAIVVEGAEGSDVVLYDAVGRQLAVRRSEAETVSFDAPASGAYLVRIGNAPARRIVVVR